jgi:hypothetical protein
VVCQGVIKSFPEIVVRFASANGFTWRGQMNIRELKKFHLFLLLLF